MKRVLITGADGFIGRNLVKALTNESVEIYAVVYPGSHFFDGYQYENLHVSSIDLADACQYITCFPNDIDVMYHFAWIGVSPEQRNDLDIQIQNMQLTLNCMKLAKEIGVKKIIVPGSTNEYLYYGRPINKDAIPSPNNAYGATKVALRYLCESYAREYGIAFVYAIITGIYAADRKDNNVIFYTIDQLLHDKKPSLTKLEQRWDYVYIDDVVSALIAIGEQGRNGAVYAIGHGDNWPLKRYIEIIHQKINPQLPIGIGEVPYDGDRLPSSCIDLTDLSEDTGYSPRIDFDEGITKVIAQMRTEMENRDE